MDSFARLILEILKTAYQSLWICLLLSALTMFLYMYVNGIGVNKINGLRDAVNSWINEFKSSTIFRRYFTFSFYTYMILYQSVLGRKVRANPLEVVFEHWALIKDGKIVLNTTENVIVFIPFALILMWVYHDKLLKDRKLFTIIIQAAKVSFLFSVTIEMLQLVLFLGTFQFSDICYNTLGGFVGGALYWSAYRLKLLIIYKDRYPQT